MTKYYQNIGLWLLLSLLITACSKDGADGNDVTKPDEPQAKEIGIKATSSAISQGTSRAVVVSDNTGLQGQDLKIDAYYNGTETKYLDGAKLHYDSSWKFWDGSAQLHYYWPFEGSTVAGGSTVASTLDFVGFCPYTKPTYIGEPTYNHSTGASFTCNVSDYMTLASQGSMQEFLVAVLPSQTLATQTAAGGALPLVFKHPFALVKFVINAASGTHVQINSISINDLYTSATCTYNGTTMSWDSYDNSATMTLTQTLKVGGTTEGTPFVVIPNNYGSKTLTVNGTWDDWSDVSNKDISTNISINWEPGYIYTYNLTVTKYALKVDVEKYTEQW